MCRVLQIPRSTYYYESKKHITEEEMVLEQAIIASFKNSRKNYGTRKIKAELKNQGIIVSRRKIGRLMAKYGLVSNYTKAQYRKHSKRCNESEVENIVNREFNERDEYDVIISDLTYVRVSGRWHYICLIIDLYNREIIGYSAGKNKDAELVMKAFRSIKVSLKKIAIFHTDRGNEFKNQTIDLLLNTFDIRRSLSAKGTPYDNAVAEATYKILKTEFVNQMIFNSLDDLKLLLADYVNWYNNIRLHGSINYMPPIKFRLASSF